MPNFVFTQFRFEWVLLGLIFLLLVSPLYAQKKEKPPREQIGEVLSKPVYRDEIPAGTNIKLHDKLQSLFYTPVSEKYYKKNKAKFELSKKEIVRATAYFSKNDEEIMAEEFRYRKQLKKIDSQLKQSGITADEKRRIEQKRLQIQLEYKQDSLMSFLLSLAEYDNFEQHLYKNYGGGRIRYTLFGPEAFDATHKWLEDREKKGEFKIIDPKLRTSFYQHWTDAVKQDGISNDQEAIRRWLRKPEWAAKKEAKK